MWPFLNDVGFFAFSGSSLCVATSTNTKGGTEADIANAASRFQREQQGRGATEIRAHIVGELVVVRSQGIFTTTEARLASTDEGRRQIKSAREELRSINRGEIETIIATITGGAVVRSYYDVNVDAAEQVEVYVLETDVEKAFTMTGRRAN